MYPLTSIHERVLRDENVVHCFDILIDRQFYKLSIVYKHFLQKLYIKCGLMRLFSIPSVCGILNHV